MQNESAGGQKPPAERLIALYEAMKALAAELEARIAEDDWEGVREILAKQSEYIESAKQIEEELEPALLLGIPDRQRLIEEVCERYQACRRSAEARIAAARSQMDDLRLKRRAARAYTSCPRE